MTQTITINRREYNVEAIVEIDAAQFPMRARYNKATWYLSVKGGKVMYQATQRHDGSFSNVIHTGQSLSAFKG